MTDAHHAIMTDHCVTTDQPELLALHEYWLQARGARAFPRRADLNPVDMRGLLEKVMVIGVERPPAAPVAGDGGAPAAEPARPIFRYRLIGTGVTFSAGYDLTGQSFDDIPDVNFRDFCQTLFERALALGAPLSAAGSRSIAGERWSFDSILLPLTENGETIDGFLAALIYPKDWNGGDQPRPAWNWHQTGKSGAVD